MDYEALQENVREAAEFLKTLGNEWRLMILCSLGDQEKSVRAGFLAVQGSAP